MKKITLLSFLVLIATGPAATAWAQTTTIPNEFPSLHRGVRPLGMGDAFVAMPGIDENAMFYNPAAINDYPKRLGFRLLSPSVEFSPSIIGVVKDALDLSDAISSHSGDNAAKINDFQTFVNKHIGQFETVNVTFPALTVLHKWFAVSLLADSRNTFSLRNRALTNVEISSRSDFGGVIGSAYNFKDALGIKENLQAGVDIKVLHRYSINETLTTSDIVNNASLGNALPRNRATGVGFDIGLKGDVPTFSASWMEAIKPTVALVWQDIGNTRFSGVVPDTPQSLSMGLAVHPKWGQWQFHVASDFRELNQNTSFIKKWNIGAEAMGPRYWRFFTPSIRIGGHQGYIAGGASLDFRYAKLEFATYGEEEGTVSRQKENRRVAVNLSFGFGGPWGKQEGQAQAAAPVETPAAVAPAAVEEPAPPPRKAVRRHRHHRKKAR